MFAVRASIGIVVAPWESAFFARGQTHFGFRRALISSIALLIAMPLGFQWFGWQGVVWATVVARATALLVLWPPAYLEGLLSFRRELFRSASSASATCSVRSLSRCCAACSKTGRASAQSLSALTSGMRAARTAGKKPPDQAHDAGEGQAIHARCRAWARSGTPSRSRPGS